MVSRRRGGRGETDQRESGGSDLPSAQSAQRIVCFLSRRMAVLSHGSSSRSFPLPLSASSESVAFFAPASRTAPPLPPVICLLA